MELTQPEIIQILRKRSGMNQGKFGAKAFDTSYESGRTKMKNIEIGKQVPTKNDLIKMANVLGVSPEILMPPVVTKDEHLSTEKGILLTRDCLDRFPGLEAYIDMLNKATLLEDEELIMYIVGKVSDIFNAAREMKVVNL